MRYRALVLDDLGVLRAAPGLPVDPALEQAVGEVRTRGLRTAVLSNADDVDPLLLPLVHVVRVSGATGLHMPDPAAYADVVRALGVAPGECVYVDDLPANVRAAATCGLTGVLHREVGSTLEELAVLLAVA